MSGTGPSDVIGWDDHDTSFEEFVAGSSARLFTIGTVLTGGDRAQAEDLLVRALERAYRRWRWVSRRGDPERYVRQIMTGAPAASLPPGQFPPAQPAPARLLEAVYRRHRRRRRQIRRVAAFCVFAVAVTAIAVPLAGRGMLAGTPRPAPAAASPARLLPAPPASPLPTVRGTVLRDCQSNTSATLERAWKAHSVQAGPLWFIYARPLGTPSSGRQPGGGTLTTGTQVTASYMIIAISDGHRAIVRPAAAAAGRFRFLTRAGESGTPHALAGGTAGLALAGCPASQQAATHVPERYGPGLTMFWQGYVTDLRGCIPLEVRTSPRSRPIRVTLAAATGDCGS